MKKLHIVVIVLIAVSIAALILTISDSSTYADFSEAFSQGGQEFHVVGKLNKDKATQYLPEADANRFEFYMIDAKGIEKKVILEKPKPQDFEKSETIVVIGEAKGDEEAAAARLGLSVAALIERRKRLGLI